MSPENEKPPAGAVETPAASTGTADPPPAPVATEQKPEAQEPGLLTVGCTIEYACPFCNELVNAGEEEEADTLELTKENEYITELPKLAGTCDHCGKPVYRKAIRVRYI